MHQIPTPLTRRLEFQNARLLRRVVEIVGEELASVYAEVCRLQHDRDDLCVFGLRLYTHLWRALEERHDDLGDATIVKANNAFLIAVGPLRIGIYGLGHSLMDDIHSAFPDRSATQRSYGQRNAQELTLFDNAPEPPLPEERRYLLNDLTIAHFGNPDEGLLKWHFGAYVTDDTGQPRWAWQEPQPVADGAIPMRPEVTPYSQRPSAEVTVKPRRQHQNRDERSSNEGSGA